MSYEPKTITFIIPIIRPDLIERCLETLYEYTKGFYVYVIDQTAKGIDATKLRNKYKNLMIIRTPKSDVHYTGNLGFAQGANLGIRLVQTPYFCMLNDDCEMINSKWLDAVFDTFDVVNKATPDRPAIMVNPASIKLPDWSVGRPKGDDFYIIPYKKDYSEEDWRHLVKDKHYVNDQLTLMPGSVIDGVTMYCSIVDTKKFLEVGYLPEQMFPGGGEDYWYCALLSMFGYRAVGTTLSWVFHHWSKSFAALQDKEDVKSLAQPELHHNNNHEDWGPRFDIWGPACTVKDCPERLRTNDGITATCPKHSEEKYDIPESKIMPL